MPPPERDRDNPSRGGVSGCVLRPAPSDAVSETATAIAGAGAPWWRAVLLASELSRSSARERLDLLTAFDLPLLHRVCREAFRELLPAVAPSPSSSYKRCQARYSISPTKVKLEPLQASTRALFSTIHDDHKPRRGLCGRQPTLSSQASRGQRTARAEAHIGRPHLPHCISSLIHRCTVSQGLEGSGGCRPPRRPPAPARTPT